jgi:uncharacterized damage-inducible protein DinB
MSGELTAADWYGHWGDYQRLLAGAIAPLDAEQLSIQAAPHLWTVRMLVSHLVAARAWWFHSWMGEGGPEFGAIKDFDEDEESGSWDAARLVGGLETTWALIESCLRKWKAADLDQEFQRPAPNAAGQRPLRDRRYIIWHVAEHDLHHGGEISFSLGMRGVRGIEL